MEITIWTWIAFNAALLGVLALVVGAFRRSADEATVAPVIVAGRTARRPARTKPGRQAVMMTPR